MAYYRFKCGVFIKAHTFDEAKAEFIERIIAESENPNEWHACTCLGFQHRPDCPENAKIGVTF